MSRHITVTVQDDSTKARVRCEAWDRQIHLTFVTYEGKEEHSDSAPSFTPEGLHAFLAVLNHLEREI